ncbi:hypothetical protein F5148DRAFT_1247844 [Russula earlei]|uniref:Uncharacterized protein n=1 Tax=Russula earlei TaxID=71964 RepID=A0ACC0TVP9_9AGAM|nr:hypothetical protein F5148DRAFT_1247844 [Russula earlei]
MGRRVQGSAVVCSCACHGCNRRCDLSYIPFLPDLPRGHKSNVCRICLRRKHHDSVCHCGCISSSQRKYSTIIMGIQWAGTLIGLIAAVLAPIPFIFLKYGARIRTRSQFAPCIMSERSAAFEPAFMA